MDFHFDDPWRNLVHSSHTYFFLFRLSFLVCFTSPYCFHKCLKSSKMSTAIVGENFFTTDAVVFNEELGWCISLGPTPRFPLKQFILRPLFRIYLRIPFMKNKIHHGDSICRNIDKSKVTGSYKKQCQYGSRFDFMFSWAMTYTTIRKIKSTNLWNNVGFVVSSAAVKINKKKGKSTRKML